MVNREIYHLSEATIFTKVHLAIIQQLVNGYQATSEIAANSGYGGNTIKKTKLEIGAAFTMSVGKNNLAKAVTYAVLHNLVKTDSLPDTHSQPLRSREVIVLTLMTTGFDQDQIAKQMEVDKELVFEDQKSIRDKIGVRTDYAAIAWGVKEFLRRQQS